MTTPPGGAGPLTTQNTTVRGGPWRWCNNTGTPHMAQDVVLITASDQGSGHALGGTYACPEHHPGKKPGTRRHPTVKNAIPRTRDHAPGTYLPLKEYELDFLAEENDVQGYDSWKLGRRQHIEGLGDPSQEALREGNWHEALRQIDAAQSGYDAMRSADEARGSVFRRVQVVEEPLTPYMQCHLHALRLQDASGLPVRVVSWSTLRKAELDGLLSEVAALPDVVVLGGRVVYELTYTNAGLPTGAIRYTDSRLINLWERHIAWLYHIGEDMQTFFARRVADLPAPEPA